MNISVVIPVYKNTEELVKNLKHNLPFLKETEVIVVNDFPDVSIQKDLVDFPQIILIENKMNLGFAGAVNTGVAEATHPYVMLLNSDVRLRDSSYVKSISHFKEDSSLFAVSFAQIEKDGNIVGRNTLFWNRGFLSHAAVPATSSGTTGWAEGGSCMIDKNKFEILHGFDTLYAPFYWEDVDLSYRAWKSRFRVYFDHTIKVEHHHESTISKYFDKQRVTATAYRNQFLFIWKNINDFSLLISHLLLSPVQCIRLALHGDFGMMRGHLAAIRLLSSALRHRHSYPITDSTVLSLFYE
ncbi:glycosyltransferase family 2 protein [Candidatus Roizmanbacteria bacterium]|nr:glycosyltransferase family 2 protein [Candidatus Roizmanbacteria bacterium]